MIKAIDFFCGAGGLTRGLMDAGIRVIAGIDVEGRCKETYESNNKPAVFYQADIQSLDVKFIEKLVSGVQKEDLLFAGCAPCQSFSKQRRSECSRPDATLLISFARLVERFKPGQVLIENVPGITKVKGFSAYKRFIRILKSNGYHYTDSVLDAKHYGVPQTRRRYVLFAMRGGEPSLPPRTNTFGSYETVRNAIDHYPPIKAGEHHPLFPNHEASSVSELNLLRLEQTPHDGGDRRAWPQHLVLDCHKNSHNGHTDVYGRMFWDRPAPTLTGKCHSISNGRYGHPCQDRAISLREAASLQTFRDDYVFYGSNLNIASQIGNAVPVRLAEVLGNHMLLCRYGSEGG
ncbi:MAG: DNA cytosine methyltransferase [Syntrophaceae bacterium]|nr:DNA cytosine methyltransferase [Syntrophaceae bacterium]